MPRTRSSYRSAIFRWEWRAFGWRACSAAALSSEARRRKYATSASIRAPGQPASAHASCESLCSEAIEDTRKLRGRDSPRLCRLQPKRGARAKLISVIAGQAAGPYLAGMASALLRLLMLAALLLMPTGMAGAPALAASSGSAAAGHCDEHEEPADAPAKPQAHCTACSALPAIEAPEQLAGLIPQAPRLLARSTPFSDVQPEIATPPPRLS